MTTELVHFRLLKMPCCGQLLCWVNPRFPNHCPECGEYIFPKIKPCVMFSDDAAELLYSDGQTYIEKHSVR